LIINSSGGIALTGILERTPKSPPEHPKEDSHLYGIVRYEPHELPYETRSICPDCLLEDGVVNVVDATIHETGRGVVMTKSCPEHGDFEEVVWSDAALYERSMERWYRSVGTLNPGADSVRGCPLDCGLCPEHRSHTALAIIDVTSRCNLSCPICFASSKTTGSVYEPSPEEVRAMMTAFRESRPVPCPGIQFAGGEPTLSENLVDYVRWAKELGFDHVMVATNGVRFAEDAGYVKTLVQAGLNTVYLQFDGVSEGPYIAARGIDLREVKRRAIDGCREAGLDGVILVPTVVGGVNDGELGEIVRFGLNNTDVVKCINFQPVSFTGRIDKRERGKMRVTIPDVIKRIEEQTGGLVKVGDWYPISSMLPLGRALGLIKGRPEVELSAHPACGMATFLVLEDGRPRPITDLVDVEGFLDALEDVCNLYARGSVFKGLRSRLRLGRALRGVRGQLLGRLLGSLLEQGDYGSLASFMDEVLMLGMMHFMDPWNYDMERASHCDIHYGTPDGRMVPFCNYNMFYRKEVEGRHG
jgi:uncharacterized radical SAM superfamily Fe-S cluster-containing enzyme